ncbi:MAG: UDP-N-acetylmuramate:L-alanyl-gamma-D-glutamyl-meso-diaminopimelate ligase [Desulfomonile tiedjei]|nr:UDP-N-acetylmuramate:L-alanyl-gamma-D-glutamyl-meso-diaminopimelate ligase [Desulfomonile tiedjei]
MTNRFIRDDRADVSIPRPPAHVHLMGICGTGMGSLAGMFHEHGYTVTGSDNGVYPPMSDFLSQMGIKVMEGYAASNLKPRPDLVVVGNVIRRTNPEAVELENSGVPFVSMPEALIRFFARNKTRIVVTGTHGKTTVSSMIAWILHDQKLDPGFMIGGLPGNFLKNHRLGSGPHFVIEGDEYDTAYFDKTPKFVHYEPHVGIMTSCEFDHGDIYDSLEQIESQFAAFTALIPSGGCLIAYGGDHRVRTIVENTRTPVHIYGSDDAAEWQVLRAENQSNGFRTTIMHRGRQVAAGTLPVVGYHNVLNALAAIAATACLGVAPQKAMESLQSFEGVKRRQEIRGEQAGVLVIDDFAHHPTEVKATCAGIKSHFPQRRLVAVFEPRTNTSKRAFFQELYSSAFGDADIVVLREPRDVEAIPPRDRFSSDLLAKTLRSEGKKAWAFLDTDKLIDFLLEQVVPGDVALIMSNGSFDNIHVRLLNRLKGRVR